MKKLHVGDYIFCLLSIIYIPFGFFYSFYSLIKLKKYSPFLTSIVYALIAYALVPYDNWDLARHFNNFKLMSELDFWQSLSIIHIRYIVLNIFSWGLSILGFDKHFLPFFVVFISYYLVLSVILHYIKNVSHELNQSNQKYVFFTFFTVLSFFPFFYLASTLRQYLSFSIIFYTLYYLIYTKSGRFKYTCLALIACFIHPSSIIIVIIAFFSCSTHRIHRHKFIVVFFLIMLFFNYNGFMSIIFNFLKPSLESINLYFPTYMDFSVINEIRGAMGFGEYILNYIILPSVFFTLLIPFIYKVNSYSSHSEKILKVICTDLFVFISLTSFSIDFLYRYSLVWALLYMVAFWSSDIFRLSKIMRETIITCLLICSVIINLSQLNMGKYIILNSWADLIYKPSAFIFYGNDTEVLQVPK